MAVLALGVPEGTWSRALEHTVQQLTNIRGIVVVVASGNGRQDSCTVAPGPPLLWADVPPSGLRSFLKLPEHMCAAAYASLARANAIKVSHIETKEQALCTCHTPTCLSGSQEGIAWEAVEAL